MGDKKPFNFLTSGFGLIATHCITHVNILDLSVTFRSVNFHATYLKLLLGVSTEEIRF